MTTSLALPLGYHHAFQGGCARDFWAHSECSPHYLHLMFSYLKENALFWKTDKPCALESSVNLMGPE